MRVRRFSPGLVMLGYALWLPAAILLVAGTIAGLGSLAGAPPDPAEVARAQSIALDGLTRINGLPPAVISSFQSTGRVDDSLMAGLSHHQQLQLQVVLDEYSKTVASLRASDPITSALGGRGRPIAYLLIPSALAGLILTLRKEVWHCPRCGYTTEPD